VSSARASDELVNIEEAIPPTGKEPAINQRKLSLLEFINFVKNSVSDDLVGVYVPGVIAFRIIDQPAGNYTYVSNEQDVVTLFGMTKKDNSIGLLAHNYLAGKDFNKLLPEMNDKEIYGRGG
jgi:hypothetical protein